MLKNKITCLIFSCNKFSDLWDGNIKLFRKNWSDRDFETFIVTDEPTNRDFNDIKIISAGAGKEWSDRLKYALQYVKTDYVFVTLDDYFLINKVDSKRMESLVDLMINENYDYIRLFKNPKRATGEKLEGYEGLFHIKNDTNYSVNLYAGIWSKKFFEFCVKEPKNAWMFEVSLHKQAVKYGAKCLVDYHDDYPILDVVRKGKILHKAACYFKRHTGIYEGSRAVQSLSYEFRLGIKTFFSDHTPSCLFNAFRKIYVSSGGKSFTYSSENEAMK